MGGDMDYSGSRQKPAISADDILRSISESMTGFIFVKDTELRTVFCNRLFAQAVGKTPEELYGNSDVENGWDAELVLGNPEKGITGYADYDRLVLEGNVLHIPDETAYIGDELHYFDTMKIPVTNPEGVIVGMLGICRDVTERKLVEDKLRENERLIKTVLDNLPIGIAVNSADPSVRFDYVNDSFARVYGIDKNILAEVDKFWEAVYEDPVVREKIRAKVLDDCASGDTDRMYWENVPITRNNAETRYISARNIPVDDNRLMISTVWDVTERMTSERELRETSMKLEAAVSAGKVGLWSLDYETGAAYFSDELKHQIGLSPWEMENTPEACFGRIHPDDAERVRSEIGTIAHGSASGVNDYRIEFRLRHKDGTYRWILSTASIIRDEYGRAKKALGAHVDITDQKNVENALRESEMMFRTIYNNIPVGIAQVRPDFTIQFANPAYCSILGYSEDELIGTSTLDITHPDSLSANERLKYQFEVEKHSRSHIEKSFIHKDGHIIHGILGANAIRDGSGRLVAILGTLVDVTERISHEETREQLRKQLLQSQKMDAIGQLAGGMAHDFNNMLAVIMGNAQISMEDIPEDNPVYENLASILDAAKRSKDLTMKLLTFARKEKITIKAIHARTILDNLMPIIERSIHKKIRVIRIDSVNPLILVDENQIIQALLNICVNARDAMPEGGDLIFEVGRVSGLEIEHKGHPHVDAKEYCLIQISDTGIGMTEDVIQKVFEPFYTTKGAEKGTGLGMSTTFGIVRSHDGHITIYSEPGHGTNVKVYLPLAPEDVAEHGIPESANQIMQGTETILIVDDEPMMLKTATQILDRSGYVTITANGGCDAVDIYRKMGREIDLVLLDMVMPDMDGMDVFVTIREMNPLVKVILISGYSINGQAGTLLGMGVQGFVQKPFDRLELTGTVREILDRDIVSSS